MWNMQETPFFWMIGKQEALPQKSRYTGCDNRSDEKELKYKDDKNLS